VAFNNGNGGLFIGEFNAQKFSNFRLFLGGSYVAIGKVSAAVGKFRGETAATRTAAAAAVSTRKIIKNFRNFFVNVNFENLADYEYKRAYEECGAGKYSRHNAYGNPGISSNNK
jgi:hypothetical protein